MTLLTRFSPAVVLAAALITSAQAQFTAYDQSRDPFRFARPGSPRRDPYELNRPNVVRPTIGADPYDLDRLRRRGSITSIPTEPTPRYRPRYNAPFYGGGYYPFVLRDPFEGYLNGISGVIGAQGQYGLDYQGARLQNQRVEQEKINTRRMLLEQRLYEQSLRPTANQIREHNQREAIRRALNDPPLTEILSADSLNVLLTSIQKKHRQRIYGPSVPVDAEILSEINVTAGTGGNVGILRDRGKLVWPVSLDAEVFAADRKRIDELVGQIKEQASRGTIEVETTKQLSATIDHLEDLLRDEGRELSLGEYAASKRFVDELSQAARALRDPKAANYFNQKWSAQGRTVAELVDSMTASGLTFNGAVKGNEAAYRALHHAMASYDVSLNAMVARDAEDRPPPRR